MATKTMYRGTTIEAEPELRGSCGAAWRVKLPPPGLRLTPEADGTVDIMIVRVDGVHPFWNHWQINVIHLRPIPGVKPATPVFQGATHELIFAALSKDPLPGIDWTTPISTALLRPFDVVEQVRLPDDAAASTLLTMAAQSMVNGMSPDQDHRVAWNERLREWSRRLHMTSKH